MQGVPGQAAVGLWAVVNDQGGLVRGDGVVSSTVVGSTYSVTFDRDISGCAYLATPDMSSNIGIGPVGVTLQDPTTVAVEITSSYPAGTLRAPFHLGVLCP